MPVAPARKHAMMRTVRAFALLLLALVCACPPRPAERPTPPPGAEALLQHLRSRAAGILALRADAKADYLDGRDRVKITVSLLAARPDRLRIAGESSLTGPLLTLATDGASFQILDVQQNRFLSGPVTPCAIARLIRVELQPREVVAALMGGVAPLPDPTATEASWDPNDGGREVLTLRDQAGRVQIIRLAPKTWDVREAELRTPDGQVRWRVRHEGFADFSPGSGRMVRLPAVTYLEDPPHKSDVRLRWRERELNPALPEGAFVLSPPAGMLIEAATCGG